MAMSKEKMPMIKEKVHPEEYNMPLEEKLIAAAIQYYLSVNPSALARIIQPRVLTLPDRNTGMPNILSSDIDGKELARLIDSAVKLAVETDTPDCNGWKERLSAITGVEAVCNATPEFYEFLLDCFRVMRWSRI